MKIVKWFLVSLGCAGLSASLTFVGIGFAVDRSIGSTKFISSYLERLSLNDVAKSEPESAGAKMAVGVVKLLTKLGGSAIETQLKGQVKPVLDGFYDYLKGRNDKPQLNFNFKDLKKDAKYFLLPNEIDVLKVTKIDGEKLSGLRDNVTQFYSMYSLAISVSVALIIFIALVLRSLRQIAVSVGVSALLSGIALLLPWLFSAQILAALLPKAVDATPAFLVKLGNSFNAAVLSIYVVSPVMLLVAGLATILVGMVVLGKKAV